MNISPHTHPNPVPHLGFGLGLRTTHYPYIFEHKPKVDWFEIISENFMDTAGRPRRNLDRIRRDYPIVMHGVALSIGTVDPLRSDYLQKLRALIDEIEPAWVSDHLCWTGIAHTNTHDLLPLPYTTEALDHIVDRIDRVQNVLGRAIALENPSTYLEFRASHIPEAEFIAQMARRSGCHLLLDVNNVYVSCYNHRLDARAYLDTLPLDRVIQIHLSGHTNKGTHIVDTHDAPVVDEVWQLYRYVVQCAGRTPNTMIEWDDHIPGFPVLLAELNKARTVATDTSSVQLPDLAREQVPQTANHIPALADAQAQLQQAIIGGHAIDSAPHRWIRSKDNFTPQAQLNVYIHAYHQRLHGVISEDYPVLAHLLGQENFDTLVDTFIHDAAPKHFNIARYAQGLPDFVARAQPNDTLAHELCVLETTLTHLADVAETAPLTPDHLHHVTPEALMNMPLHPRAALSLLAFSHPVNTYYQQVMDNACPARPEASPSHLVVFRHDDTVWRMDLEADEYQLLTQLFSGKTLGDALASVASITPEQLSLWCSRWMRSGLLAAPSSDTSKERPHHAVA